MLPNGTFGRSNGYRDPLSMSAKLIIALIALFALSAINQVYVRSSWIHHLALTQVGISRFYFWQPLTFQFLHGSFIHLALNCLMIWWFGRFVEQTCGPRRLLTFFLLCGVVGGVLQALLMVLFPAHFASAVIGASAGTSGLFAIFARLMKEQEVRLYMVLPVRAETLLWVFIGIEGFFTLVPVRDGIAHAAHLGGLLMGIQIVRLGWHQDFRKLPWEEWWSGFKSGQSIVRKTSAPPRRKAKREQPKREKFVAPETPAEVKARVDQILDKISEHGLNSLTQEERDFLERARSKM